MAKYTGNIDGHVVIAELGISGHWFVELDGHKVASGYQITVDRPVEFMVSENKVLVRFSGLVVPHIEVYVNGDKVYSV